MRKVLYEVLVHREQLTPDLRPRREQLPMLPRTVAAADEVLVRELENVFFVLLVKFAD
jgi:hypothetical protein